MGYAISALGLGLAGSVLYGLSLIAVAAGL